jgi:hypothetical protein
MAQFTASVVKVHRYGVACRIGGDPDLKVIAWDDLRRAAKQDDSALRSTYSMLLSDAEQQARELFFGGVRYGDRKPVPVSRRRCPTCIERDLELTQEAFANATGAGSHLEWCYHCDVCNYTERLPAEDYIPVGQ